jgi:hypothetical protein
MDITRATVCPYCKEFPPHPDMQDDWCGNCEPSPNGQMAEKQRPEKPSRASKRPTEGDGPEEISSWRPVNLEAIVEADVTAAAPALLPRSDGVAILYSGKRHLIASEPEGGKSWLAMKATAEEIRAGHRVLYLDFEATAHMALERLEALGVPLRDVLEFFAYVRPMDRWTSTSMSSRRACPSLCSMGSPRPCNCSGSIRTAASTRRSSTR